MKRRGAAKGSGSGYRNLRGYPKDPMVHSQAAKGIKQPQMMKQYIIAVKNRKIITFPSQKVANKWADKNKSSWVRIRANSISSAKNIAKEGRGGKAPLFQCMECGRKFSSPREECPNCGGADIDLYVASDQERFKRKGGKRGSNLWKKHAKHVYKRYDTDEEINFYGDGQEVYYSKGSYMDIENGKGEQRIIGRGRNEKEKRRIALDFMRGNTQ